MACPIKINLIGYFHYFFGLARSANYLHQFLSLSKIPHEIYNVETSNHAKGDIEVKIKKWSDHQERVRGCLNIYLLDIHHVFSFHAQYPSTFEKNTNVYYYYCEVHHQDVVPKSFFSVFDAIFTSSEFIREYIRKHLHTKTLLLPLIDFEKYAVKDKFDIPSHTLNCLFITDLNSCRYRKNIDGFLRVVEAMPTSEYFFILKISNLNHDNDLVKKIRRAQKNHPNFLLMDRHLTQKELDDLYSACHVYLSLHRAEGYGLTIFDAMMHKLVIMCVDYSSPSEFLRGYAHWVRIQFKTVSVKDFPLSFYSRFNTEWADPDLDDVIQKLKLVPRANKSYPENLLQENKRVFNDFLTNFFSSPANCKMGFNWRQYYVNYDDIRRAGLKTQSQLIAHFEHFGKKEGRTDQPVYYFDCNHYFYTRRALKKKNITRFDDILEYWIKSGDHDDLRFLPADTSCLWDGDQTVTPSITQLVCDAYGFDEWNSTDHRALGFYYTWPDIKNAEYEIVERWKMTCQRMNINFLLINNNGTIWQTPFHTNNIPPEFFYCIISSHWESPKTTNVVTYGLMWNPIAFLQDPSIRERIQTVDKFIPCSSPVLDDFYRSTFPGKPFTTYPIHHSLSSPILDLTLGEKKCFYVGINWEALNGNKGRFHDLFTELDKRDLVNIYGPEIFLNQRVWRDYRNYKGEIPFDGESVIHMIHRCGIGLVLSSKGHVDSAIVSSRLFECLAAGVAIISNKNPWVEREFGDDIFYVDTSPEQDMAVVAERIGEIVRHISENEDAVMEKVRRCREKFLSKFLLDHELKRFLETEFL